jgi:membrane protease YdiL (CAAX protease family)
VTQHSLLAFFILAYALSWLAWLLPALGVGDVSGLVALHVGSFGPAAAAAIILWYTRGPLRAWLRSLVHWRVPPRWYLVAVGLPVLWVALESVGVVLLGYPLDPALIPGRLVAYLPMLLYTGLAQGGNEEPGWRGFALPRLQQRYAPVAASLLLGLVWAFWHLPLLAASPETLHGSASLVALLPSILLTIVNIVALTFVYTWLYNRTQSVLLCILLHASGNTANALLVPLPDSALQGDLYQAFMLMAVTVTVLTAAILVAATRGRLGADAGPARDAARVPAPVT